MSSTAASSSLAGLWFGELAAAVQSVAAGHGGQQRKLLRTCPGEQKQKVSAPAAGASVVAAAGRKAAKDADENVGRCGGAMSDTTLYLLLDRFAPS